MNTVCREANIVPGSNTSRQVFTFIIVIFHFLLKSHLLFLIIRWNNGSFDKRDNFSLSDRLRSLIYLSARWFDHTHLGLSRSHAFKVDCRPWLNTVFVIVRIFLAFFSGLWKAWQLFEQLNIFIVLDEQLPLHTSCELHGLLAWASFIAFTGAHVTLIKH